MNAEERWKRLKEYLEDDVSYSMMMIDQCGQDTHDGWGWVMAKETERDVLAEMARLEKED